MTDKQHRLKRRWLYIPFVVAGVILFAYYLLWRAGAAEMKKGVNEWVADQRAAGMIVEHESVAAEGFPFFLRVHVDDPHIEQPGAWRWRAERLTLDALPYDLNKLIFSTRGAQDLWLDQYGTWRVLADDIRTSIANDKERDWIFAATVGGLEATRTEDGEKVSLESLVLDLAPDAADKTTLTLNLAAGRIVSGNEETTVAVDSFQAFLALTHVYAFSVPDPASAWRSAGGELQIKGLAAQIENARLSVSGAVRLDGEGYPAGALNTEVVAPAAFATTLGHAGVMTTEDAETIAAALTLAAIAGGGKVSAPIQLENGAAHFAGVKLGELPQID